MKVKMALMVIMLVLFSACTNKVEMENTAIRIDTESIKSLPDSSSAALEASKEDNSVRAIGIHQDGRLVIKPDTHANVSTLGAPSCYGVETDLSWSGDYEVLWEPTHGGTSSKVMTFPIDFEIIRPGDEPVNLQMFTLGDTEVFAYNPRYTDCHALETYLFAINDGQAFPITFEMKSGVSLSSISRHPLHPIQASNGELILMGGEGAGQDFVDVYHFQYDSMKHLMVLQQTDQIDPSTIKSY